MAAHLHHFSLMVLEPLPKLFGNPSHNRENEIEDVSARTANMPWAIQTSRVPLSVGELMCFNGWLGVSCGKER